MSRTDIDPAALAKALRGMAGDGGIEWVMEPIQASVLLDVADALDENDRLRERITTQKQTIQVYRDESREWREVAERAQAENAKLRELVANMMPSDSEGRALDIADTVHMLRSEHDGDHEWDDVVVELAWTKWGGDRWIVRGSKGEAWACDCTKTGYDEDAYESSDDVEPFGEPTLLEVENAKLRELAENLLMGLVYFEAEQEQRKCIDRAIELRRELDVLPMEEFDAHELGIEVD